MEYVLNNSECPPWSHRPINWVTANRKLNKNLLHYHIFKYLPFMASKRKCTYAYFLWLYGKLQFGARCLLRYVFLSLSYNSIPHLSPKLNNGKNQTPPVRQANSRAWERVEGPFGIPLDLESEHLKPQWATLLILLPLVSLTVNWEWHYITRITRFIWESNNVHENTL